MKKLVTILLLIGSLGSAQATNVETLLQLQQQGNVASLTQIAQTGNYNAQILLIEYYKAKKNKEQVFYWIKEFAKQNNDYAQNALGVMYLYGINVEYNPKRAIELFELADKQNNAEAQYNLSMIYANGMGVPKDTKLAEQWRKKACNNGFEKVCY